VFQQDFGQVRITDGAKFLNPNTMNENLAMQEPEFTRLVESMRRALNLLAEQAEKARYLASALNPMPPTTNESFPEPKQPEPKGIIENLWFEVNKLESINVGLQITTDHLHKAIGS